LRNIMESQVDFDRFQALGPEKTGNSLFLSLQRKATRERGWLVGHDKRIEHEADQSRLVVDRGGLYRRRSHGR
jgi:hypothetical protein